MNNIQISPIKIYTKLLNLYKCGLEDKNITPILLYTSANLNDPLGITEKSYNSFDAINTELVKLSSATPSITECNIAFIIYLSKDSYKFNNLTTGSKLFISFSGEEIKNNITYDINGGFFYVFIQLVKSNSVLNPVNISVNKGVSNISSVSLDKLILQCSSITDSEKYLLSYPILQTECLNYGGSNNLCNKYYKNETTYDINLQNANQNIKLVKTMYPNIQGNYFNNFLNNEMDYLEYAKYPIKEEWKDYNKCPTSCGKGFKGKIRNVKYLLEGNNGSFGLEEEDINARINCDIICDESAIIKDAWINLVKCPLSSTTPTTSFISSLNKISEVKGITGKTTDRDVIESQYKDVLDRWRLGNEPTNSIECYGSTFKYNYSFKKNVKYYSSNGNTYIIYTDKKFSIFYNTGSWKEQIIKTTSGIFISLEWKENTSFTIFLTLTSSVSSDNYSFGDIARTYGPELRIVNGRIEVFDSSNRLICYLGANKIWENDLKLLTNRIRFWNNSSNDPDNCRLYSIKQTRYIRFHSNGNIVVYNSSNGSSIKTYSPPSNYLSYSTMTTRGPAGPYNGITSVEIKGNAISYTAEFMSSTKQTTTVTLTPDVLDYFFSNSSFFDNKDISKLDYNFVFYLILIIIISLVACFISVRYSVRFKRFRTKISNTF